jgi:hypothetical protein
MDLTKKIIKIKDKNFLITSVLKMKVNYNILGFWEVSSGTWAKHVSCIELPHKEFENLISES